MSRPSDIPFLNFISLDKSSDLPLYRQIAQGIIQAIVQLQLSKDHPLPSSRALSKSLLVNRNTVVNAFEELSDLGWIYTQANQGSFVANTSISNALKTTSDQHPAKQVHKTSAGFSFQRSNVLDIPYEKITTPLYFTDGTPDYRLSILKDLNSNYSASLKKAITQRTQSKHAFHNSDFLLENTVNYLNISRGLHLSKDNLLLCRSHQMALFLCTQILLSPDQYVLVGELNHFNINMNFTKARANIARVALTEQGLCLEHIEQLCLKHPVRLLYISAHHHYPTTACQSAQNRIKLLALAKKYGFIIFEDDYQYDYSYNKHPVLPLMSQDTNAMCIYSGTLGYSLPVGYNLGYVVGPKDFIDELKKHQQLIDPTTDIAMQRVIAQLIHQGEYFRIQKKSTAIYQQRRDLFCNLLKQYFPTQITFEIPSSGLALWLEFTPKINLMRLKNHAHSLGLTLGQTLLYQNKSLCAMRLGFAHLTESEMIECVEILHKAYLLSIEQ